VRSRVPRSHTRAMPVLHQTTIKSKKVDYMSDAVVLGDQVLSDCFTGGLRSVANTELVLRLFEM